MAYASLADLKDWVGIPPSDTEDDDRLTLALDAASDAIDRYTGQYFTADEEPTVWDYTADAPRTLDLVAGIVTTTGLVVATDDDDDGLYETTWDAADYRLEPTNAAITSTPWTRIVAVGDKRFPTSPHRRWPGVRVTTISGWAEVPARVKQAVMIQAAFIWGRKDARFGVAGSPEFGNEMRVEAALDRTAQELLKGYRRTWWVL
jgi:hypothetical protein